MTQINPSVAVYGTDWCPLTRALRNWLDTLGVRFDYHNIERDPEAERAVIEMNGGKRKFPMVKVDDVVMKNPSLEELNKALARHGLLEVR